MKALCAKLGYHFNDMKLLETALTHPSYGGDHHVPHYQRLEFLGDAVLELAISMEELPAEFAGSDMALAYVDEAAENARLKLEDLGLWDRLPAEPDGVENGG